MIKNPLKRFREGTSSVDSTFSSKNMNGDLPTADDRNGELTEEELREDLSSKLRNYQREAFEIASRRNVILRMNTVSCSGFWVTRTIAYIYMCTVPTLQGTGKTMVASELDFRTEDIWRSWMQWGGAPGFTETPSGNFSICDSPRILEF
jgi:hypothetical protein